MEVEFREADHSYWLNSKRVPNVTSVLDLFAREYADIPEWILEPARQRGQAVHLATAYDDLGVLDSLDDSLMPYLEAWRKFRRDTDFRPSLIEQRVFSPRYFYAGVLDRTGIMLKSLGDQEILLDIKTGSALRATTGPQTAAYEEALRTDRRKKRMRRFAIELHADGTYWPQFIKDMELRDTNDLPVFLAALTLFNWRTKHVGIDGYDKPA